MYNIKVLESLERGEISVGKAISMLKHPPRPKTLPKGNILLIRIRNNDKRLTIPIPLCLIDFGFLVGRFGLRIADKFSNDPNMKEVSDIIKYVGYGDIKKLVYSLRVCKSTGLVEVRDEDSMVIIDVA